MISDTLSAGLQQYRIGPKMRALRLRKKLGLVELGRHSGLSPAMLSKIERGVLFPTLPTLLRIALVFPDRPGDGPPAYLFESLDFPVTERKIEAFYAEFPHDAPASELHRHEGA